MWGKKKHNAFIRSMLSGILALWFSIFAVACSSSSNQPSATTNKNTISETANNTNTTTAAEGDKTGNANSSVSTSNDNTSISGQLKIHFIDVGQADSILIQQGANSMLIDAGNNDDSTLVKNYITSQGIKKLDYVVGTHPHEDHIGGLDVVINSFQIGKIYMPKVTSTTATFKDVITAINNKGMKITTPVPGSSFKLGSATCQILAPNLSSYSDLNNYSIVIKLTFGKNTFMFDGDAGAISEMEVINKGFNVKADVLKVGHHGSNTATCANFLKAVNPKYAVISVGVDNSYGHPQKGTMDRLKNSGIPVYRTDEGGTIICTSDGTNIKFSTKQGDYSYRSSSTSSSSSTSGGSTSTSTGTTTKPSTSISTTSNATTKVYITTSGSKYHLAGCSYLSKSCIETTLKEAVNDGLTPCSRCNPPTLK
jgi:competence protein ComEC